MYELVGPINPAVNVAKKFSLEQALIVVCNGFNFSFLIFIELW